MPRDVPGIYVAGTGVGVGKTVVSAGLARLWSDQGYRVGVFKPIAIGCERRTRIGLISNDAECLAYSAGCDVPLDRINPVRYGPQVVPMAAAEQTKTPIDEDVLWESYEHVCHDADAVIVEGIGGLLTPLARRRFEVDLADEFGLDLLLVGQVGPDAVSRMVMAGEIARSRKLRVVATVLNGYDTNAPSLAEETDPGTIARCSKLTQPVCVPQDGETDVAEGRIGARVLDALARLSLKPRKPR